MSSLLHLLAARISHGRILLWTPDGRRRAHDGALPGPTVRVRVHDAHLARKVVVGGASALGAAFLDGGWETDNLPDTLRILGATVDGRVRSPRGQRLQACAGRAFDAVRHSLGAHGAVGSMADHYNLGNDFYAAWLDATMTYSSALFDSDRGEVPVVASLGSPTPQVLASAADPVTTEALVNGQQRKYDRILDQLELAAGDRVLEIGFGWGGFAEAAAARGIEVTGVTIAREQLDFGAKRLVEAGAADHVDLRLLDFADIPSELEAQSFDAVVSIEMIESIPQPRWGELFTVSQRMVSPGGRVVFQIIMIADDLFATYAQRQDFITTWIFPGGRLPSPTVVRDLATEAGLVERDVAAFGASYATTLATWWRAFDAAFEPRVRDLGFDDRFRRMWHYYLAYCQAGFEIGRVDVQQWSWESPSH